MSPNAPPPAPTIDASLGVGMVGGVKSKRGISGPCVVCDTIVSFEASTCPHCGQPDAGRKAREKTTAETKEQSEIVEKAIRDELKKPTGELTETDILEKVTALSLSNNQLTDVKGLERLTQLTHLNLCINQLTDVKGLEKLTQLTYLNFGFNQLTDVKGLEKLTQLTYLKLCDNQLTDVKNLEELTKLETLDLLNNPDLTKAQIAELQKALPECKIISNATK